MSTISRGYHAITFKRLDLALLGLTPAIMVLLAWDFGREMSSYRGFMRGNSFPVSTVQLVYIAIAVRRGFAPVASLLQLPTLAKAGLLLLHTVMFWTTLAVAKSGLIAFFGIFVIYIHLLFWLACVHQVKTWSEADFRHIWTATGIGVVVYALLWLFNIVAYHPQGEDWMWLVPALTNIRWVGFFALASFCGGVGALVVNDRNFIARNQMTLPLIFMALGWFLAIWTGSRGAILAIIFASAFSVLVSKDRKTLVWAIVLAALTAIAIAAILPVVHPAYGLGRMFGSAANSENLNSLSSNRIVIWAATVEKIIEQPWLGFGIDQYRLSWPDGEVNVRNPHQSILQLLFASGIAGAVAYAMIAIPVVRRINLNFAGPPYWAAGGYVVAGTLYGLYDGFFYYAYPVMLYLLSTAILIRPFASTAASDRSN
jgi:O-antigen ligase